MDEAQDQELIANLARQVIHLKTLIHALILVTQKKTGYSDQEFREAFRDARLARRDAVRKSAETPEESAIRFLQEFEGTEQ